MSRLGILGIGLFAALAGVSLPACQRAPWLGAARHGSLAELKQSVMAGRQRAAFDRQTLEDLSMAVLEREIQSATDPDGETLLGSLTGCAARLEEPLTKRSRRRDETAGTALGTLVAAGRPMSDSEWSAAAESSSGARRAAAALDALSEQRWARREQLLNDADPRVRRAALTACGRAPSPTHWDTMVAILRRDPDLECRALGAKALGTLGGPEASTVLGDAWSRADPLVRQGIVSGLAQAATFGVGGQQRLTRIARSEPGLVGVLAAADLATGESEAKSIGQARVTRALEFGSNEDRLLAVQAAAWTLDEQARLLLRLGLTSDPEVRVAALGRWLERPAHRWPAFTWLRELALTDSSVAIDARVLLANNGDSFAVASLRDQLRYQKQVSRNAAARGLFLLGDYGGVATALADDAPEVRITTACLVLSSIQLP